MWTAPNPPEDYADGPGVGDDRVILPGYLHYQRGTLLNICAGLTAEQLARTPLPSGISLLGLVRHMAKVERIWLRQRAAGLDVAPLYGGPGDPTDFADIDAARAPQEFRQLLDEWAAGDAAVAAVPLEHTVEWRLGTWSLRMIYVHLIGEYARHNGHADLIREAIDGVTDR